MVNKEDEEGYFDKEENPKGEVTKETSKNEYKDINKLRDDIYSISMENIETAKGLYKTLVPKDASINVLAVISEQAVNCLRVINENTTSLIRLYSEINKAEQADNPDSKFNLMIYKELDRMGANPYSERKSLFEASIPVKQIGSKINE